MRDALDHLAFTFHLEGRFDRVQVAALDPCKAAAISHWPTQSCRRSS